MHGHPSKDTLRRFCRALDSAVFKDFFVRWMQSLAPAVADRVIAIDGKTSRHSGDGTGSPLHLVSAFACEARLVLGQQEVADKSNEITAIPVLLAMLALEGAIITIDAMGCQHKIADVITGRKGQYILPLKGNQGTLHDDVKLFLEDPETRKNAATYTDVDAGHGRIETRTCTVTDDIDWLKARHPAWQSLHSIVRLESI